MNYILQLNEFRTAKLRNHLTCNQVAVYIELLAVANDNFWKMPFSVGNKEIINSCIGITELDLRNIRRKLASCGLIEFEAGTRGTDPRYIICKLYQDENEAENSMENSKNIGAELNGIVTESKRSLNGILTESKRYLNGIESPETNENSGVGEDEENQFNGILTDSKRNYNGNLTDSKRSLNGKHEFLPNNYKTNTKTNNNTNIKSVYSEIDESNIHTQEEFLNNDFSKRNNSNNSNSSNSKSSNSKNVYGKFNNVLLNYNDLVSLKEKLPDSWETWIETFSEGIERKDYKYKNHYLAILNWVRMADERSSSSPKTTYAKPPPNTPYVATQYGAPVKKNKFSNYNDTSTTDYAKLEQALFEQMCAY